LNRWKNVFSQVLNVHVVHTVRQKDIHTTEPLVPESTLVEVETATGKIPAALVKAGGGTLYLRYKKLFVLHGIRGNFHSSGRNLL
jgi:hypothetical protein